MSLEICLSCSSVGSTKGRDGWWGSKSVQLSLTLTFRHLYTMRGRFNCRQEEKLGAGYFWSVWGADDSRGEWEGVLRKQFNKILFCWCDKSAPLFSSDGICAIRWGDGKDLGNLGQFQPANQMEKVILAILIIYWWNHLVLHFFCEESGVSFSRALTNVLRIMMAVSLEFIFKLYFEKNGSFS